jgi:CRP-like cAMP-binding protein
MSQLLIANIERFIKLTDEEKYMILSIMQSKKIRKRQYFIQEGDTSRHSAFVLKGCMRSYFVDTNGFEHILQFAIEDWWITDLMSTITGKPARLNVDALEDTEVLLLPREDQLELFEKCPKFEKYFRIITENGMISSQQRLLDNLSLPAIDRYNNFVQKYPLFAQRIPQTQIAAYLGITPEFLSKIRNQNRKS